MYMKKKYKPSGDDFLNKIPTDVIKNIIKGVAKNQKIKIPKEISDKDFRKKVR